MHKSHANVFTIPCDAPFLDILSKTILTGFPFSKGIMAGDLAAWTVLVPTRRAARELQFRLLADSGKPALVLPNIRPIGDVDEDLLEIQPEDLQLPPEIPPIGRAFALMSFVDEWARDNPHLHLAQEIAASPGQAQSLAASLAELVDSLETEEISLERIPEAYQVDLAAHREAILSLLDLIRIRLPAFYVRENIMGAKERRGRLLRLEASRLREHPPRGPIIAAGSTGTIHATRELLKAISKLDNGAVILPGLDQHMDAGSWDSITPQHPQYTLKQLIDELGVARGDIPVLGEHSGQRGWLASELMRPSDVSDQWQAILANNRSRVREGLKDVSLIEARDRHDEASIIALIMRREFESPAGEIALVTPDRGLARRVKSALVRWNISVDDSAGEPLIHFGAASLMGLLMDAVRHEFSAPALVALLGHPLARFGFERDAFRRFSRHLELTVFRSLPVSGGVGQLVALFDRSANTSAEDAHPHPSVRRLEDSDWQNARTGLQHIAEILLPLSRPALNTFSLHLENLISVAENIAGPEFWLGIEAETLRLLMETLRQEARRFPACDFNRAAITIRHHLQSIPLRNANIQTARLSILGLLEARLVAPQTVILGGLNEGNWPRQVQPGPWLNRPMRDIFGMHQPERQIGQSAHDFIQAFGAQKVFLTWSRRDGMEPAIPSRWILRLQTIAKAAGLDMAKLAAEPWQTWAVRLDEPPAISPLPKPLPRPPVFARPRHLSVTRIETLIRDPYAIYASSVLGLEPLAEISARPDAALRGTLFHTVIGEFFGRYPLALPAAALDELINLGRLHFLAFKDNAEIMGFWWNRFARLAAWIIENEISLRSGARRILAETRGILELQTGAAKFMLSARADRIDLLTDGTARIIDFKTGEPPSAKKVEAGFSPQLTLQAAMLSHGAFEGLGPHDARELLYIKITGGVPPGLLKPVDINVAETARRHLENLIGLLEKYQDAGQAYIPRYAVQNEDEVAPYDHLSRYREWVLSGDSA